MARPKGSGSKIALYNELLAKGVPPAKAVVDAGYSRPAAVLKEFERAAAKREQDAKAAAAGPASDAELARGTLRTITTFATNEAVQVTAARALLDASPPPSAAGGNANGVCVIFSGREGTDIRGAVDPHDVAEAIRFLRDVKERGHESALEAFAQANAVDVSELAQSWYCWTLPEVQKATLRALDRADPTIRAAV